MEVPEDSRLPETGPSINSDPLDATETGPSINSDRLDVTETGPSINSDFLDATETGPSINSDLLDVTKTGPSVNSDPLEATVMAKTIRYKRILCFKLKNWSIKKVLLALFLGQVLSLLLCGTSVTSGLLNLRNVTIPTAQSLTNYALLATVYTPLCAFRRSAEHDGLLTALKERGWKYALLSVVDVEGNFLMVKAYHYTSVTSVQLLDCFTIPGVLVLSYLVLKVRYKLVHIAGVVVCLLGVGGLIAADALTDNQGGQIYHSFLGDLMVLGGACMYAISNVAEEFVVKKFCMIEFLAMIGMFGTIVSSIQLAVLERNEVFDLDFTDYETVLLLVGFALCLFIYYSLMPVMMKLTSAAVVNLSILSADFYALFVGLFVFRYAFHPLYFVAFCFIIVGVIVFCSKEEPQSTRSSNGESLSSENDREASIAETRIPSVCAALYSVEIEDDEAEMPLDDKKVDENTPLRHS